MLLVVSDASLVANFHQVYSRLPGDPIRLPRVIPLSQLLHWRLHFLVLTAESSATRPPGHYYISAANPSTHRSDLLL
jgi:hypothetical protein